MTDACALRLNSAACSVWFYQQGIIGAVSHEAVRLVQSASVAQIQRSSEVVQAINAHAPVENGMRRVLSTLAPEGAGRLKDFADSLSI